MKPERWYRWRNAQIRGKARKALEHPGLLRTRLRDALRRLQVIVIEYESRVTDARGLDWYYDALIESRGQRAYIDLHVTEIAGAKKTNLMRDQWKRKALAASPVPVIGLERRKTEEMMADITRELIRIRLSPKK
jgi:hypothetical protein